MIILKIKSKLFLFILHYANYSGTKNDTITLIANIQQALEHYFVDLVHQRK